MAKSGEPQEPKEAGDGELPEAELPEADSLEADSLEADSLEDSAPSRYIEKIRLADGDVLDDPIRPEDLLIHSHRDYHPVDIHARYMTGRVVRTTGSKRTALRKLRKMRGHARRAAEFIARLIGHKNPKRLSEVLFGLRDKDWHFRFRRRHDLDRREVAERIAALKAETAQRLESLGGGRALRVLLTGGTGFIGKEFLWQVSRAEEIAEVAIVIRPKEIVDRKTGEVRKRISAAERGEHLLRQIGLDGPENAAKFSFVAGDIEEPRFGLSDEDFEPLVSTITHVVHCAASVSFDDPYERSYRANVLGSLNALAFSRAFQQSPGSPFVAHISIETAYIHGRDIYGLARESDVTFPRNFYNNYYEVTKAMASIEAERFMLTEGLRLTQLCPSIVIGEAGTGNNRGDTKVVNAPVNLFGRAFQKADNQRGKWWVRSMAPILVRLAAVFPGDPSARINLISVDRIAAGMVAALRRPEAIGERVHLASDRPITSQRIADIVYEELGVKVKLAEPTLHRTVGLPILTRVLRRFKQERAALTLQRMTQIFGGYSEWSQPVHEVGNDVRLLGLSSDRPDAEDAFRMLCRHNRHVQNFGRIRDGDEIARRERIWREFLDDLEERMGMPAAKIPPQEFHAEVEAELSFKK